MNKLFVSALFAFCPLMIAVTAVAGAPQPDLAKADWSVKSPHSLATNPPSDDAVTALVEKLTEQEHLSLCSSHFVDLRHSGNLSLVVAASDGRFCSLWIIDKTPSGFELSGIGQSDGAKIEDLAGNGNLQLIADTPFTPYQAINHCMATWPVIYAWTGSGYTDVSSQYKGYYEQQLKSLKKQIAASPPGNEQAQAPAANQTPEPQPATNRHARFGSTRSPTSDLLPPEVSSVQEESPVPAATPAAMGADDCTEAEAAKIERFLGISRDAGMSDAIKWANNDAPNTREFAIAVLNDIATPDAIEHLRSLSNDTDGTVAAIAKFYLASAPRGPILNTVDRQEVKQPAAESPPQ